MKMCVSFASSPHCGVTVCWWWCVSHKDRNEIIEQINMGSIAVFEHYYQHKLHANTTHTCTQPVDCVALAGKKFVDLCYDNEWILNWGGIFFVYCLSCWFYEYLWILYSFSEYIWIVIFFFAYYLCKLQHTHKHTANYRRFLLMLSMLLEAASFCESRSLTKYSKILFIMNLIFFLFVSAVGLILVDQIACVSQSAIFWWTFISCLSSIHIRQQLNSYVLLFQATAYCWLCVCVKLSSNTYACLVIGKLINVNNFLWNYEKEERQFTVEFAFEWNRSSSSYDACKTRICADLLGHAGVVSVTPCIRVLSQDNSKGKYWTRRNGNHQIGALWNLFMMAQLKVTHCKCEVHNWITFEENRTRNYRKQSAGANTRPLNYHRCDSFNVCAMNILDRLADQLSKHTVAAVVHSQLAYCFVFT